MATVDRDELLIVWTSGESSEGLDLATIERKIDALLVALEIDVALTED